ncbi:MAG TPA: hypothetical protein VGN69_08940 [Solirubrobacteraceae bacterium]|nr:hypothetical protein [Solirubrobacteraceae bacterium]
MAFARTWLRQSLLASGAITLIPVGVLLALALTAVGGGLGGLGSLDELVSGPTLPTLPASIGAGRVTAGPQVRLPAIPAAAPSVAPGSRGLLASTGSGPGRPGTRSPGPRPAERRIPSAPGRPGPGRPAPGARPGPSSPASPGSGGGGSAGTPTGAAGPVRQAGAAAQQAAQGLPAPAGQTASDAVGTVVDLVAPPHP